MVINICLYYVSLACYVNTSGMSFVKLCFVCYLLLIVSRNHPEQLYVNIPRIKRKGFASARVTV